MGILILVVAAVFQAQASDQTPQQRHTREQLAKIQAEHIAHDLALDDKTASLFIDTYCQSQREVWAVVGNRVKARAVLRKILNGPSNGVLKTVRNCLPSARSIIRSILNFSPSDKSSASMRLRRNGRKFL